LGSRSIGDQGSFVLGPVARTIGGVKYWWWKVDFQTGTDGWVAGPFLQRVATENPVTVLCTGVVNNFNSSTDQAAWQIGGVDKAIGDRFAGSFTYNASATRTRIPQANTGYFL
jgi:hypothetical protein